MLWVLIFLKIPFRRNYDYTKNRNFIYIKLFIIIKFSLLLYFIIKLFIYLILTVIYFIFLTFPTSRNNDNAKNRNVNILNYLLSESIL